MLTIDLVEGWTGAVPLTLEADDAGADLSGLTVAAALYDKDGTEVDATSDVTVSGASAGEVDWYPDVGDLTVAQSPYELRFQVTDAQGKDVSFPNGMAVRVVVRR